MTVQISDIKERQLIRLSKKYDKNKDGQLDKDEVRSLMYRLNRIDRVSDTCDERFGLPPEGLAGASIFTVGSIALTVRSVMKTEDSTKFGAKLGGKIARGSVMGTKFLVGSALSLGALLLGAFTGLYIRERREEKFSNYEWEIKQLDKKQPAEQKTEDIA